MADVERNIMAEIKNFFGGSVKEFMDEWKALNEHDKVDLRQGFLNGSMTY